VWFVYILRCADGSFYVGETNDVQGRLADHNRGRGSAHTVKHRPVTLAYVEEHPTRSVCLERERQIKRWTRVKKAALIAGDALALRKA
jgi:predicted GIY-YIG superfamily endonuclease